MRGNITRRGRLSWQIKFDVPAQDGKRQQRYATVRGTYKDAQKELTKLLNAADEGTLPDPSSATIADYLRIWLNGPLGLSPKTLERYRELGERQIIPQLGATKLQKLKPEHVQRWHGALIGQGLVTSNCRSCPSAPAPHASMRDEERNACPQRGRRSRAAEGREHRNRNIVARTNCRGAHQT